MPSKKDPSQVNSDVKIAMAVESKYLYARDDAMRNSAQNKLASTQKA